VAWGVNGLWHWQRESDYFFQCVLLMRNAAITGANWTSNLNHGKHSPRNHNELSTGKR